MAEWIRQSRALLDDGHRAVLVAVAGVRGSAPRDVGTRMLVTANETIGTIGGGQLEHLCTRMACDLLRDEDPGPAFLHRIPLGADCGQCCGGVVDVLFEPLEAAAGWLDVIERLRADGQAAALLTRNGPDGVAHAVMTDAGIDHADVSFAADGDTLRLAADALSARQPAHIRCATGFLLVEPIMGSDLVIAVFGAGHVGSATVGVLATLDASIRWIDTRRDMLPECVPPNVQTLWSTDPAREVAAMPPRAFYLVMTHSHPLDLEICDRILARGEFAYLGLIGSGSKRRRFERRLAAAGHADLHRLTCPIGVGGLTGKAPAEIAIAAAAEVLRIRSGLLARGNEDNRPVREIEKGRA